MPRIVRILQPQPRPTFADTLEAKAQQIANARRCEIGNASAVSTIESDITFVLHQIDRIRGLHAELRRNLVRQECYADNELNDMEMRTPRYSPYRFPEREKLQRRLVKIEDERRRLAIVEEEKMQGLHEKLLTLLNDRRRLHLQHGN